MRLGFCAVGVACAGLMGWMVSTVQADLTLAAEGKSDYVIVTPSSAPVSVRQAAQELQKDIELASGAKLAIGADEATSDKPFISLGETKQAKAAGFSSEGMPVEGWRIVSKDGNLYIFGVDTPTGGWTSHNGTSTGTANGVYTFLEDTMGVRWVMPGDLGRVVPEHKTLILKEIDQSGQPTFHYRRLPYARDYTNADQLKAVQLWMAHLRVGYENASVYLSHSHNWWGTMNRTDPKGPQGPKVDTPAVHRFYKAHPDWFAMDAAGKRPFPRNKYSKFETTNQELVKWFAQQAVEHLKANKRPATYSLSPSDGSQWSQSPASKALWDPSPAEQFHDESLSHDPSMSSLILTWYDQISKIVEKEYPQGRLAGYIYASYLYPPVKASLKLPENFVPVIAPSPNYGYGLYRRETQKLFHEVMSAWAKVAPKDWYYYDLPVSMGRQHPHEIGREGGFPGTVANVTPAAPAILNDIASTLLKSHIDGAYIYGSPAWGTQSMSNYMLAKLLWDPKRDAHDVQRDWLEHAYGPGAGAKMETFYSKLDGWFQTYYQAHTHKEASHMLTLDMLKTLYAAHYPELESLYLEAAGQPMTQPQKQRLQLIGDNLSLLQWRLRNVAFLPADYESKLTLNAKQAQAVLEQKNDAFPLFPGVVGLDRRASQKRKPASWRVKWEASGDAAQKGVAPKLNESTFVLYARKSATVRIEPKAVRQSAYFASYEIKDAKGEVLGEGVFTVGSPVTFEAGADQAYFLSVPSRNHVNYTLDIADAGVAEGTLRGKVLHLHGNHEALVQVYYAGDRVGLTQQEDSIQIAKPFVGAGPVNQMRRDPRYSEARVLASLPADWKFQPDPKDELPARGVTTLDFDDSGWKTISTLNWWQFQGFKDYHGAGWYRKTFEIPPRKKGETTRVYFGSVDGNAVVYLNGHKLTEHKIGPAPDYEGWNKAFSSWISPSLWKEGKNVLAVKVTGKNDTGASGITGGVAIIGRINAKK